MLPNDNRDIYVVATDPDTGSVTCSCGATSPRKDARRFLKRHPKLCSERRQVSMELAKGTRCVDEMDRVVKAMRKGLVD